MQMQHFRRSRTFMQVIHILSHNRNQTQDACAALCAITS